MTFLNPALLWGLALISIPIIIHIFNLKRTKKIEFSTLMFLKEIQQSKYKKIKLKQLLILLCRIAFIIFLVLAFSRPFEKGYLFSTGTKAKSSALLVIDDSFSMLNRESSGSDLDLAKAKLIETLNLFDENDEVYFSTVSAINKSGKNFIYRDLNALKDTVKNLKVSDVSADLNSVIYFSGRILGSSANADKEIFLFTDGQKTFIENNSGTTDNIKLPENTKLNIVLSGNRKGNNLSLDTADVKTKIFEKNKAVKIKCTVTNHNVFNVSNKSVVMTYGPKSYRDEKVIDIPANSTVDVEFSFTPGINGFAEGNIELLQNEISEDEIPNDNKQYFAFYVPASVKMLLVSSAPADISYFRLALSSSEEMMKDSSRSAVNGSKVSFYDINQISADGLGTEDLSKYNCVAIVNKPSFTTGEAQKIKEYLDNGGGIVIYPGDKTQLENYNSTLFKEIDVPYILSKYITNENKTYRFENADMSHPIFDGMFIQNAGARENLLKNTPEVKSGFEITTGKNSRSIISLTGNKNFLVEYTRGKGKLLLFAVPPDMSMSDFPAKTIFPPITVRSILYLSPVYTVKPAVTGKDYFFDFSSLGSVKFDSAALSLISLANNQVNPLSIPDKNAVVNLKNLLNVNSAYALKQNTGILYEFPANFERKESLLDKFNSKEITSLIKEKLKIEPNVIPPENNISASIFALRTGKELWQYLLIFSLIFLIVEFLIARTIKS